MPAEGYPENLAFGRTGLLVVCPSDLHLTVRDHVSRHADQRWEHQQDIIVLPIPKEKTADRMFVTSEINRTASRSRRDLRMLTVGEVRVEQSRLRGQLLTTSADMGLTPNRFGRSRLPNALKGLRLDWRAGVADSLANAWDHGNVDEARIEAWLNQFEMLQSHGWVGERLLRVMDFWSSARIRQRLGLTNDLVRGFSHICVNRRQAGKSADSLANKIQKKLNEFTSLQVSDLYEILSNDGTLNLLYFEDCLLTGTEISKLLGSLLGRVAPGRTPKVPPLPDQALLRQKNIAMRFLVTSNLGSEILKQFLAENDLLNIQMGGSEGELITLTPLGVQALREGALFDQENCLRDPSGHIVLVAFQEEGIWGSKERIERAIGFCRQIGEQLFRHYLSIKQWQWPERRIRESSLGVRSVALALAFAHSVPKATLPLFWMEGPVRMGAKEVKWQPLFPSAA